MTKVLYFALKIKGGGREGGTCEVLRPCHPPQNLERAQRQRPILSQNKEISMRDDCSTL